MTILLILGALGFSITGFYSRAISRWEKETPKNRAIGKMLFYFSMLLVIVCVTLLILPFFGIHILQIPK